jgi:hypothetical protein
VGTTTAYGALAQEQTRIYGPNGRSLGTAAPCRTTFTTTTMNGVTRFYDSGGHLTGTVIGGSVRYRDSRS